MPAPRVYREVSPPPIFHGPQGFGQYAVIVTAATKAEAAELSGLEPKELEWERETCWFVFRALADAGLLAESGRVYATEETARNGSPVYRKAGEGWELLGTLRYTAGSMVLDPA